jgi:hypothetical protein
MSKRDIKASFRLPAELNDQVKDLLKRDKFKIYSFSDITILALDEFMKKYNNSSKQTPISNYMQDSVVSEAVSSGKEVKNGRQKK